MINSGKRAGTSPMVLNERIGRNRPRALSTVAGNDPLSPFRSYRAEIPVEGPAKRKSGSLPVFDCAGTEQNLVVSAPKR